MSAMDGEIVNSPIFTQDWFSMNIPVWDNYKTIFFNKEDMRCLEIGSFEGRSTIYIADNYCNGKNSYVEAIDTWNGSIEHKPEEVEGLYKTFTHNVKEYINSKRIIPIRGNSSEVLMKMIPEVRNGSRGKYDFIYIDGSHVAKDVLMDAVLAWEILKIDGVMIFDDYRWEGYKVYKPSVAIKVAIDGFMNTYAGMYNILHNKYQLHIQKISDNPANKTK